MPLHLTGGRALAAPLPLRILHAHPTFDCGGKEARTTRLMNAFGASAEHVLLSARAARLGGKIWIDQGIACRFPVDGPAIGGVPTLWRLYRIARYMRGFDLVLTYNRGAANVLLARLLFGGPPIVHHEDGFNADEAIRLKPLRNLHRRIALRGADKLVVPSRQLVNIAEVHWRQHAARITRIVNGVSVADFRNKTPVAIPGFERRNGEVVIGTVAGLRPVKNQQRLIRAFARLNNPNARLIIVGEGAEDARLRSAAAEAGVGDRVIFPGFLPNADKFLAHFDIFALSSDSEQFPIAIVEAMSAGLPIVSTDVGDIRSMVSRDNRRHIVRRCDEDAFASSLAQLAHRADIRMELGLTNLSKARRQYQDAAMIAAYASLYNEVIQKSERYRGGACLAAASISPIEAGSTPRLAKWSRMESHQA